MTTSLIILKMEVKRKIMSLDRPERHRTRTMALMLLFQMMDLMVTLQVQQGCRLASQHSRRMVSPLSSQDNLQEMRHSLTLN